MAKFARRSKLAWATALSAASICVAAIVPLSAADTTAGGGAIPNFSSANFGWLLAAGGTDYLTVAGQTPPVTHHPKYPHVGNNQSRPPTQPAAHLAHPPPKPRAAEPMK